MKRREVIVPHRWRALASMLAGDAADYAVMLHRVRESAARSVARLARNAYQRNWRRKNPRAVQRYKKRRKQ